MLVVRLLALAVCAKGGRVEVHDSESVLVEYASQGKCAEAQLEAVCKCSGTWTKVCRECKDQTKWGVGCALECPSSCPWGCDFLGNCNRKEACKRQARDKSLTDQWPGEINEFGLCQACHSGAWGPLCEKTCPSNCEDIEPEGNCTRAGNCYKCKLGWYAPDCSLECPEACEECVMKDDILLLPGTEDVYLPAGACVKECENGNLWGRDCDQKCPANCLSRQVRPGCYRHNGECINCQPGWWGPTCSAECPKGCLDDVCDRVDGRCSNGCKPGFWEVNCDVECPERTLINDTHGCVQEDGRPYQCEEHYFPEFEDKDYEYMCEHCPRQCKGRNCDSEGLCTTGCKEGFYGETCHRSCGSQCIGACDKVSTGLEEDGYCTACYPGHTGKECTERCDPKCFTCFQNYAGACESCDDLQPEELQEERVVDGVRTPPTCVCMEGAERGADGHCHCKEPSAEMMEAFFEDWPERRCGFRCQNDLKMVSGEGGSSACIPARLWKAVLSQEVKLDGIANFLQGVCGEQELEIRVEVDDATSCLRKDFVQNILASD